MGVDSSEPQTQHDICWICHEAAPDLPPPCGNSVSPMFHRHCLRRARLHTCGRCPHCNMSLPLSELDVEDNAHAAMEEQIKTWPLRDHSWWIRPSFMCILRGRLLNTGEAGAAVRGISTATTNAVRGVISHVGNAMIFRDGNIEIGISLERVACVGCLGCIESDGYTTSVYRRRVGTLRNVAT